MDYDNSFESLESMSPADVAQKLFQSQPGEPCSRCILPHSQSYDNDAASFNFEILLTIYLEGFMNICISTN